MSRPGPALVVFLVVASFTVGLLSGSLATGKFYGRFDFLYGDFTIETCLKQLQLDQTEDLVTTRLASQACYERLQLQGTLNDFLVRRVNFQTQHFAEVVMMWMVVMLTSSGVGLAAYQIVASARLAPGDAPESELSIERGRLFIRSSITGLFILIASFAFFYVYVVYVYTIYDIGDDAPLVANEIPVGPPLSGEGVLIDGP